MEDVRFITHMSHSRNKTAITDETKTLINFYNSVARECPYNKSTVLCATRTHTVVCHQFIKADYTNKRGETKKKLALVTDRYTICELFRKLKTTMIFFPKHRYNNAHTKVYKKAINNLRPGPRSQWKLHMFGAWWSPVPTLVTNTSDIISCCYLLESY